MGIRSAFLYFLFFGFPANAGHTVEGQQTLVFKNSECAASDTCDLLEFNLFVKNYKVFNDYFGTATYSEYKTKKISDLENYAIVQFIRGCKFNSSADGTKWLGAVLASYFGRSDTKMAFRDWHIDSYDEDPMYSSWIPQNAEQKRHALYRYNDVAGSFQEDTEKRLYSGTPSEPRLYVRDMPSVASYGGGTASNVSLEFKTCIYKTEDVPERLAENEVNFAEPISCHQWAISKIYNHKQRKFESISGIHDYCKETASR